MKDIIELNYTVEFKYNGTLEVSEEWLRENLADLYLEDNLVDHALENIDKAEVTTKLDY